MKTIISIFLFSFLVLTVTVTIFKYTESYAQWQADSRLTNDTASSFTSTNNAWCIASTGNFVYASWEDRRDGNSEIYHKRSTDGGATWGADTRLTNNASISQHPSISVSGTIVHVVWEDTRDGNLEIYYKRSTNSGVSWSTDTRLTNNPDFSIDPCISSSGQDVRVVWRDDREGNSGIYYKRSTDGGASWGADTRLTDTVSASQKPAICVSGSVVHVAWADSRVGNAFKIYYKRSTDGGVTWGADTQLTNLVTVSQSPCISVSDSVVHIVWNDERSGDNNEQGGYFNIFYKRSTDGGITWSTDAPLIASNVYSLYPSVASSGQIVQVIWCDDRDGNFEIYNKRSTNGGINWGPDTRLTNAFDDSIYPSVSISNQAVHVVWIDHRDGNFEIYYKRNPTGNLVGLVNINSEIPEKFHLFQNYPNPFNPGTKIRFELPVSSNVKLVIYDVLGKEVETLIDGELSAGTYEPKWNAEKLSGGVYFYKLEAGGFVSTKKMVLIK
ncbi:MAG: exo-alpha-sialidase [Ignavibacteriae bacterium]|nr:exo-alpha-sialidase [Ignavibacteriota bacterium]MCB9242720.1 exo-alpha-sialidase [Ignavibacteriales bacterium]